LEAWRRSDMQDDRLITILRALEDCSMGINDKEIREGLQAIDVVLDSLSNEVLNERLSIFSLSESFGFLCTILAEFPPYRFETAVEPGTKTPKNQPLINAYKKRQNRAGNILIALFKQPQLSFLRNDLHVFERLILSTLEPRRFMPFRVIQVGKIADQLFEYSLYFDSQSARFLKHLHLFKYPRFGTSGWRARWKIDCDEQTAKCVASAICDFVTGNRVPGFVSNAIPGAADRSGKVLLIGYDSRAHARRVAEWVAHIATENGIKVMFTTRDTPTPALLYWALEVVGENNMAGIVNCTASHNPPEWQGIKFSPFNGVPAPTAVTDFIASRANLLKLRSTSFSKTQRGFSRHLPETQRIDPQNSYCNWLLSSQRKGISISPVALRHHFHGKTVIIDEMYGAGRGYFRRLMRELGVRYSVIHGQRSQKSLEELGYASPEWPYIAPLAEEVGRRKAALGVGLDTDADRFGIIGGSGKYIPPNRILPLLTDYLLQQGYMGKIVRTTPGSRIIDRIASSRQISTKYKPSPEVIPSYITHAFYLIVKGTDEIFRGLSDFLEPVGIKYVVEGMLIDTDYKVSYSPNFRDTMLLGGEESSGLTSKSHLPDKDGIWGNLLVMNMLAVKGAPVENMWKDLCRKYGNAWFERIDVDAGDLAKEKLVSHFFKNNRLNSFAGMDVKFIGGVMYDLVEIQLHNTAPEADIYLEVRASGTEPLNRIYVEAIAPPLTADTEVESLVKKVQQEVLNLLAKYSIEEIKGSRSPGELASILAVTSPDRIGIREAVTQLFSSASMRKDTLKCLERKLPYSELRNRATVQKWLGMFLKGRGKK
jgi:phosphomannomutase